MITPDTAESFLQSRARNVMDIILVFVFTLILGWVGWLILRDPPQEATPMAVSSPTVADPIEVTPLAPLKVYKPEVKRKTALGKGLKVDEKKHLVATTKVESEEKPVEVSTVLDERTGDFTTVVTELPTPLVSIQPKTEIFAEHGIRASDHKQISRLGVNHQLFKVKGVAFGVTAQVDSEQETFVGARVSYRW